MHVRTQIRHRIAEALAVLPATIVHRSHLVHIDPADYKVGDDWVSHCIVYTFSSANAQAGGALQGCLSIPYQLNIGVAISVAGFATDEPEILLDDLEMLVLPIVTGNLDADGVTYPSIDFISENTTPSAVAVEFPEYVRQLSFDCNLLLDMTNPSEITRL